jgi:hypothetical protein
VREGRARAPQLPADARIFWIRATKAVNDALGTHKDIAWVMDLDADWLAAIVIDAAAREESLKALPKPR